MQFHLTKATAKLNSFNIRAEKHGDEDVPAADLKLSIHVPNTILDLFDPDLCAALYRNSASESGQTGFEGLPAVLPNLRFKNLDGPIKLKDAGVGYTLVIDRGLGDDKSNIVLNGCEVNHFAADLQDGGTVELSFRVQITNPSAETIGRLGVLVQHELTIDLHAPEVDSASVTPIKKPRKRLSADEAQMAIADALEAGA